MPRPNTPLIPPGALDVGRDASHAAMVDRCVIERDQPPGTFNPDTGLHDPPGGWTEVAQPADVLDDGLVPCRIHPVPLNEKQHIVGDEDVVTSRYYGRLPMGSQVALDDRIAVVQTHPTMGDPNQQGLAYRVVDDTPRSLATETRVTLRLEHD